MEEWGDKRCITGMNRGEAGIRVPVKRAGRRGDPIPPVERGSKIRQLHVPGKSRCGNRSRSISRRLPLGDVPAAGPVQGPGQGGVPEVHSSLPFFTASFSVKTEGTLWH